MAGALADSSAFVRRAPAHSNEHTVRDLLFPRQAATNSSSSAVDPGSSTTSSTTTTPLTSAVLPSTTSTTSTTPTEISSTTTSTTPTESIPPTTSSDTTSTSTVSSAPPSTVFTTSLITTPITDQAGQTSSQVVVVTVTSSNPFTSQSTPSTSRSSSSSSTSSDTSIPTNGNQGKSTEKHGLTTGATTAIAVVIPVVVVTALLILGLWFWRRRKQRKNAEDERRKEMEDYGYNPNNDPTLPNTGAAVGVGGSEMAEDHNSGYRGWGGTQATSTGRKASTTLSGGMANGGGLSDTTSQPGGYHSPNSASVGDGNSGDALISGGTRRETMESGDGVGALGSAPAAGAGRGGGVQRGPSNASSSYSAGGGSHTSNSGGADAPIPVEYGYGDYDGANPYHQPGPYDSGNGAYGHGQPVVRDVSAKRSTRIESPTMRLQQGNSGIAQNF